MSLINHGCRLCGLGARIPCRNASSRTSLGAAVSISLHAFNAEVGKEDDQLTDSVDQALSWARDAAASGTALSIALMGNAADIEPELVRRGERFDAVTDQTSAHDALGGYVPAGLGIDAAAVLRAVVEADDLALRAERRAGQPMVSCLHGRTPYG